MADRIKPLFYFMNVYASLNCKLEGRSENTVELQTLALLRTAVPVLPPLGEKKNIPAILTE